MNEIIVTNQVVPMEQAIAAMANLSDKTIATYKKRLADFLDWCDDCGVQEFTATAVTLYMGHLKESGASSSVGRQSLGLLKNVARAMWFAQFIDDRQYRMIQAIPAPKQKRSVEGNWLTNEDAQRLFDAPLRLDLPDSKRDKIPATRMAVDRVLIALMMGCGLRVSEAISLRYEDITKRRDGNGGYVPALKVISGKGDKDRVVRINGAAYEALIEWLGMSGIVSGHIVRSVHRYGEIGEDGVSAQAATKTIKKYAKIALGGENEGAINNLKTHDLRKTHALSLAERGVPLTAIQEQLGHEGLATTRLYLGGYTEIFTVDEGALSFFEFK